MGVLLKDLMVRIGYHNISQKYLQFFNIKIPFLYRENDISGSFPNGDPCIFKHLL